MLFFFLHLPHARVLVHVQHVTLPKSEGRVQCAPTIVLVLILHCDLAILVNDDFPYLPRLGHSEPTSVAHALTRRPLDPRQVVTVHYVI